MKKEQKIKNLILGNIMLFGFPLFQGIRDLSWFEYTCMFLGVIIIVQTVISKRVLIGNFIEMSVIEIHDKKQNRKFIKSLDNEELEIALDIILRNNKAFFWPFGRIGTSGKTLLLKTSTGERFLYLELYGENEGYLKIMDSNYWVSLDVNDYSKLKSLL